MSSSIKLISTSEIQDAFAEALSELTGKPCFVSISSLKYEVNDFQSFTGTESISFSANATLEQVASGEKIPI